MAVGRSDLNLLIALEALLEEGNVTRAGRRLGISQPAMSASLARLRRRLDDDLLVPSAHGFDLTPLGKNILPDVQRTVRLMRQTLLPAGEFDPASANQTLRLSMSDYSVAILLPPLLNLLATEAPGVRLVVEPLDPEIWASRHVLVDYDALFAPISFPLPGISRPLWRDRMVILADRGNSQLRNGVLTSEGLGAVPHAAATFGPGILPPIDRAFSQVGIRPKVSLQVTGFLPLPSVVRGTDVVAAVPERLARIHVADSSSLVMVEPPFAEVPIQQAYWFAKGRLADPLHRWFFALLDRLAVQLPELDGLPRPSR
jgi:DNA-binding transcriptional LysR family regulator